MRFVREGGKNVAKLITEERGGTWKEEGGRMMIPRMDERPKWMKEVVNVENQGEFGEEHRERFKDMAIRAHIVVVLSQWKWI